MKTLAFVLAAATGASAGSAAVAPSDLLVADDVPSGFELVVEPPTDLTFEEYAELSPEATAHVDPGGDGARSMRAAVDVWTSADDDVLLREVTRWGTESEARAFVEQAIVVGVQAGLDRTEPAVDGGVAHQGADQGLWTRTVTWQQGPYAMSIAHFAVFEGSDAIIDGAVTSLAARVAAQTGRSVAAAPGAGDTTDATSDDATSDDDLGGGITIGTIVLWVAVIGGVTWLIMRLRRRAAGDDHRPRGHEGRAGRRDRPDRPDDPDDLDDVDVADVIERARARAEGEIDAIPDPTEPGRRPPGD